MSNKACAIKDGSMLFERCLIVPNKIPAINVQRAKNPILISAVTTGDKNKQLLYPVCDIVLKNIENGTLILFA